MRMRLLSALVWTAAILIACWTPKIYFPVRERGGFFFELAYLHLDKVVHLGIFGVFAVLWLRALPHLPERFLRISSRDIVDAPMKMLVPKYSDGSFEMMNFRTGWPTWSGCFWQ